MEWVLYVSVSCVFIGGFVDMSAQNIEDASEKRIGGTTHRATLRIQTMHAFSGVWSLTCGGKFGELEVGTLARNKMCWGT